MYFDNIADVLTFNIVNMLLYVLRMQCEYVVLIMCYILITLS